MSSIQIYRYELNPDATPDEEGPQSVGCSVELPKGAEVLGFGPSTKGLILWAAVDVDEPETVLRHFVIVGNGVTIDAESPLDARMAYVDTAKFIGGPTFHVFEFEKVTA